mmetsp:Transcript_81061/g.232885  ORF Transcript_81061/g.232885 Transcript_81061/m.232885 type:complete len:275 (-) Transcript_81061:295-1119(-)
MGGSSPLDSAAPVVVVAAMSNPFGISNPELGRRLDFVRSLVAKKHPVDDPEPSLIAEGLFIGNKHHAADVGQLCRLGITVVLNCAPSGIRALPLDDYEAKGIRYAVTNVKRDDTSYPLLHDRAGVRSAHLDVAKEVFDAARRAGGRAMFFCVAGQNRSATLAVAALLLCDQPLPKVLHSCAARRPFVLENEGFQRQVVELEALLLAQQPRGRFPQANVQGEKRLMCSGDYIADQPTPNKKPRTVCGLETTVEEVGRLLIGSVGRTLEAEQAFGF